MVSSVDGVLWVREFPHDEGARGRWRLFDSGGCPVGRVRLPVDVAYSVAGSTVALRDIDGLGVYRVLIVRLGPFPRRPGVVPGADAAESGTALPSSSASPCPPAS